MALIGKLIRYVTDRNYRFLVNAGRGIYQSMPDEDYLRRKYEAMFGRELDLNNPKTFNEKLQWLKLHDHNPLYTTLVDKVDVKLWVAERIGEDHVVPTYAVWDGVDDIDISTLPEKFVLKTNHDSGGIVICNDRAAFDFEAAKRKLYASLKRNFYYASREWPYKDVKPKVFAEAYLEDIASDELVDYKFMCFGGEARCSFTCTGRAKGDLRIDFFDREWNHLPFTRHYPNADILPEAPASLKKMQACAEQLSKGIPFARVDFYEVGGRFYFGELTFYPGAGFEEFDPEEWDERLGSWIDLPETAEGAIS